MTVPLSVVVLLAAGTTLIIASGFVLYSMIGEVNRKLPEDQQIPYFFSFSYPYFRKVATLRREYERFYPNGHLNAIRIAFNIVGAALIFASWARITHLW